MTIGGSGKWTERILHNFNQTGRDGVNPSVALIFDASENLYTTTLVGGANGQGTVFKLTPSAGGAWTETILHSFSKQGTDGYNPGSALVFDASGNLYGTTGQGGAYNQGSVFEIAP